MLKISLLASAFALALFGAAQAGAPTINASDLLLKVQTSPLLQLADSDDSGGGNSGSGSDSDSGGGNSGSGSDSDSDDNDSDDDSSDDNSSGAGNGDNNDDGNDDSSQTVSGRKKPRIPGGSGCDDAGDIAEHPECSPN